MKKNRYYIIASLLITVALGYMIAQQTETAVISPQETHQLLNDTAVVLLDVRTVQEHAALRIIESPLITLRELESKIHELEPLKNKKIIMYCRSGNRSGIATKILRQHGFNAVNMLGGITRWKSEQLPVIYGVNQ